MSLRQRLRPIGAIRSAGGRWLERRARRSGHRIGLVLMYHEIAPVRGAADEVLPALGADLFRAQLEHLKGHYEVVAVRDLLTRAEHRSAGDRVPVAITFDDDYSRHATVAAPMLTEFGFPATFFLCGNALQGHEPYWWQDLQVILNRDQDAWPKLRQELAAEWSWAVDGRLSDFVETIEAAPPQLRDAIAAKLRDLAGPELLDQGLAEDAVQGLVRDGFDIGFHTRRHYRLQTLDGAALDQAMRDGVEQLTEVVGYRPTTIAYPHARADLRVADSARRAGFDLGFVAGDVATTAAQPPLLLARVSGIADSLASFRWSLGRAGART